jgi:hypothetical protein
MAVKLGRVNVDAMLRSITAKQFQEWEAYAKLEPFNELRDDYRFASIVAMIFNMAVAVKDRKTLAEFVLPFGEQPEPPPKKPEELEFWAKMIALAYSVDAKDA